MISIPKSLKNQHWHLDHPFEIPNHVNTQKLIKIWSPGGSQNPSKIIKNSLVDPKVPSWMSPGTPWPPTGAKMMSQGVKMESQGLQNHRFGYSRSHQSHKSASPALQVNRLPKGPAAGGNALRIYRERERTLYTYIGNRWLRGGLRATGEHPNIHRWMALVLTRDAAHVHVW